MSRPESARIRPGTPFSEVPASERGNFRMHDEHSFVRNTALPNTEETHEEALRVNNNVTYVDLFFRGQARQITQTIQSFSNVQSITGGPVKEAESRKERLEDEKTSLPVNRALVRGVIIDNSITEPVDHRFIENIVRDGARHPEQEMQREESRHHIHLSTGKQMILHNHRSTGHMRIEIEDFDIHDSPVIESDTAVEEVFGGPLSHEDHDAIASYFVSAPSRIRGVAISLRQVIDHYFEELGRPHPDIREIDVAEANIERVSLQLTQMIHDAYEGEISLADIPIAAIWNEARGLTYEGYEPIQPFRPKDLDHPFLPF